MQEKSGNKVSAGGVNLSGGDGINDEVWSRLRILQGRSLGNGLRKIVWEEVSKNGGEC